jgi:hypothetical protein
LNFEFVVDGDFSDEIGEGVDMLDMVSLGMSALHNPKRQHTHIPDG